jgi:beta-glucanase (GH16 family)
MRITLLTCLFLALTSPSAFTDETSLKSNDWQLAWQDEFEGKELSPEKWNVLTREQSKHNELQYYVPDDVYLQDGCLRLRSRKRDFGTQNYTSAQSRLEVRVGAD